MPAECWCQNHCQDEGEARHRRIVATAAWEFRGGEALHVFVLSKEGTTVSLCNLRQAVSAEEVARIRSKLPDPTKRCDQCCRTLRSRVPNARMRRYLAAHPG